MLANILCIGESKSNYGLPYQLQNISVGFPQNNPVNFMTWVYISASVNKLLQLQLKSTLLLCK